MSLLPFISLAAALIFTAVAWVLRRDFWTQPYFHWFIYFHLAAVGLHQFEEYGWPGKFRDALVGAFNLSDVDTLVPTAGTLELLNVFGFMTVFGLIGWLGTRRKWIGLILLFLNFSNGYFHLVYSVTRMIYIPGVVTGTLLYLPLGLLAAGYAVRHKDITLSALLGAFVLGTLASFSPFIHVWIMHALLK